MSLEGRYVKNAKGLIQKITNYRDSGLVYLNNDTAKRRDIHYDENPSKMKNGYELMPEDFNPNNIVTELEIEIW